MNAINKIFSGISKLIKFVTTLFKCFMALTSLISQTIIYIGKFTVWVFVDFMPWIGQYFECALNKIIDLPKCFFWYLFDCIIWFICFVARLILWIIDSIFISIFKLPEKYTLQSLIHDYFWCPLEDLDKFIHDTGPNNLGTGFHIIHYPDSVMDRCYNCHIKPIRRKMPSIKKLKDAHKKLINCDKKQPCTKKTKCEIENQKKVDVYYEKK